MEATLSNTESIAGRLAPLDEKRGLVAPWWLWVFAAMLCACVGLLVYQIQTAWMETHSQIPDPATYTLSAIRVAEEVAREGRWVVAWQQVVHNPLNPLRLIPLVLLAPRALIHPLGHLCTTVPMLYVFIALLGATAFRRSGSAVYACCCMMTGCAVPGLYNGTWGLGPFWLDLPAGLLIAAAGLALLNSDGLRRLSWCALAALLISWAALSRYVAGVYGFFVCGPVIAAYFIGRLRSGESWKECSVPILLMGGMIAAFAGWFVVGHYSAVSTQYAIYGFGNKGMLGSFQFTISSLEKFLSPQFAALLVVPAVLNLVLAIRAGGNIGSLAIQWWFPAAVVAFLTISCEVGEAAHGTFYAVPLLVLAALLPAPSVYPSPWALRLLGPGVAVISLYLSFGVAHSTYERGIHPAPVAKAIKESELKLGRAIADQGARLVWVPYFDECDTIVTVETFAKFGVLLGRAPHESRFTVHESYWKGYHPDRSVAQVASEVFENATGDIDIAIVPQDPARALALADNDYSREVIRQMTDKVPADPNWKRIFEVESPRFGLLAGYRNQNRLRTPH